MQVCVSVCNMRMHLYTQRLPTHSLIANIFSVCLMKEKLNIGGNFRSSIYTYQVIIEKCLHDIPNSVLLSQISYFSVIY